jgi:hypothetical protein
MVMAMAMSAEKGGVHRPGSVVRGRRGDDDRCRSLRRCLFRARVSGVCVCVWYVRGEKRGAYVLVCSRYDDDGSWWVIFGGHEGSV